MADKMLAHTKLELALARLNGSRRVRTLTVQDIFETAFTLSVGCRKIVRGSPFEIDLDKRRYCTIAAVWVDDDYDVWALPRVVYTAHSFPRDWSPPPDPQLREDCYKVPLPRAPKLSAAKITEIARNVFPASVLEEHQRLYCLVRDLRQAQTRLLHTPGDVICDSSQPVVASDGRLTRLITFHNKDGNDGKS